jgi:hypothetical protein
MNVWEIGVSVFFLDKRNNKLLKNHTYKRRNQSLNFGDNSVRPNIYVFWSNNVVTRMKCG